MNWLLRRKKQWLEERSCSEEMAHAAQKHPGVQRMRYDYQSDRLEVEYDSNLISKDQVQAMSDALANELGARIPTCALRNQEDGLCESCLEVGKHGKRWQMPDGTAMRGRFQDQVLEVEQENRNGQPLDRLIKRVRSIESGGVWWQNRVLWETLLTAITLVGIIVGALLKGGYPWAAGVSFVIAYLAGGYYGVLDSFQTLKERRLDVNILMILAALGAAAVGEPAEGATLLFLFSLSNTLQNFALARSRNAIRALMTLQPDIATRLRNGEPEIVSVDALEIGDRILIKPGERVPTDGLVVAGESHIDQSPITGESVPVYKLPGATVYAGTMNGNGSLEVEVTAHPEQTLLSRILALVEQAQEQKAQTQRWLERFEQRYAVAVIGGAALTAVMLPALFQWTWSDAFYRAMTLLVVASPCALVISTPATLLSAIANAARRGILFKGGEPLERLAEVKAFAFDKTGTLTEGKRAFTDLVLASDAQEAEAWQALLDVESLSEHPMAQALANEARRLGYSAQTVQAFQAIPGQGVQAQRDGTTILIGNPRLFEAMLEQTPPEKIMMPLNRLRSEGKTAVIICVGGRWLGVAAVSDRLRESAAPALANLRAMGITETAMLTGDAEAIAQLIAKQTGVQTVYADLLPDEKLKVLETLSQRHGKIAMVGDGVNDAPALAAAEVGIAMGAGTDVALETADIALVSNDLNQLPYAVALARQSMRVMKQNLYFATAVIITLIILTFWQGLRLPLGVIGHEGSTLLVVLNGLRLIPYRPRFGYNHSGHGPNTASSS